MSAARRTPCRLCIKIQLLQSAETCPPNTLGAVLKSTHVQQRLKHVRNGSYKEEQARSIHTLKAHAHRGQLHQDSSNVLELQMLQRELPHAAQPISV